VPEKQTANLKFYSTSELPEGGDTVLYWGREKTGKSHNMATWPGVLFIHFALNPDTVKKFPDVPVLFPEGRTYRERLKWFHFSVLPAIQNRKMTQLVRESIPGFADYTVKTIALDDYTCLGQHCKMVLAGAGDADQPDRVTKIDYEGWNQYLAWLLNDTTMLLGSAAPYLPDPSRECYNFVAAVHERDSYDDTGSIVKITPSIDGQFKDDLASKFGLVLVTDSRSFTYPKGHPREGQRDVEYFCHTIPPDRYRKAGGGRGKLPAKVVGTYPELQKAWNKKENE
jgi:hypothetical protein